MTPGFVSGFPRLHDATRWAVMARLADEAAPPPHESVLRCGRHGGLSLRFGEGWRDLASTETGVVIETSRGSERFDAAILGTGFTVDLSLQPALDAFAGDALLWRDRVEPEQADLYPELAQHPYLDYGFGLVAREGRSRFPMDRIHLLGSPAAMSHGTLAADIPGLAPCCLRLARCISDALFVAESASLRQRLFDFEEAELAPTPLFVALEKRRGVAR